MTEIEPWLERTLFLLNSKAEDSTEQLRLMLEESIRSKYGYKKMFLRPIPGPKPASQKKDDSVFLNKKKKADGKNKLSLGAKETGSSDTSSNSNESDFTMEILEDELSCVVCREISIIPHNRMVECADCHSLYHQECHNPPIEDSDVNDPRGVWYCNNCSKSLTNPKSSSSLSLPSSSKSSYQKVLGSNSNVRSSSSFSSKPFGGLSVPPKKSSSSSSSNSSKSSSSNGSKSVSPNMNIINADKRLQIMKKKAAKKQEKRINSK